MENPLNLPPRELARRKRYAQDTIDTFLRKADSIDDAFGERDPRLDAIAAQLLALSRTYGEEAADLELKANKRLWERQKKDL